MLTNLRKTKFYNILFKLIRNIIILSVFQLTFSHATHASENTENNNTSTLLLDQAWEQLSSKKYADIESSIRVITQHNPPEAVLAMSALLEGQLYYNKKSKQIFIMLEAEDGYIFNSLFSEEKTSQENKRGFKKVKTNNRLRRLTRQTLATIQLKNSAPKIRLEAVEALLKNPGKESASVIQKLIASEKDRQVISAMQTLLAIHDIKSGNEAAQLSAITVLSESLNPVALNALVSFEPSSKQLKQKKIAAIKKINNKRDLYANIETVFFGLSLGSVLALSAIGLAITFGVMGVINMAHGELMMIGAYTTYVIQLIMPNNIGASIIVAIPAAFIVAGLVGIAIERGVIKHLYGRPLETLLATFGISLILQQVVRSIFSPLNRSVETPQWMSDAWQINEVLGLTWNRLYIIIFCLLVFISLILVMKKTVLGLQVRAVSQNRKMARAMGVRSEWVDALTFGLGSGIAGLAGVALSLLTNVGPNLGQAYIIDSFMVVVFGGVGNLWGTLVAGMSLGVINKLLEPWAGAVLAKILVLVFIILFIQKRPKGLFPQRGRAAED